jgi:LPS-assembly lipoprotein
MRLIMQGLADKHVTLARRMQGRARALACALLCMLLTACGFHLKGVSPLPFDTLYTNIGDNSAFGVAVRRAIVASSPNTRFVAQRKQAQAQLIQLSSRRNLREISIDVKGKVEEYELTLEFSFQLLDAAGRIILPPTTLHALREIPYDDTVVQAKQGEIATVFREMEQSLVSRIVRHLASPDVTEAFQNAESQPVDENAVTGGAVPAEPERSPWTMPRVEPGMMQRR